MKGFKTVAVAILAGFISVLETTEVIKISTKLELSLKQSFYKSVNKIRQPVTLVITSLHL